MDAVVTGATGRLGQLVVAALDGAGHRVRQMSSQQGPTTVHGDLATGAGLSAALDGAEVVLHAASDPRGDPWRIDVAGTRRLVEAVDRDALRHLVYVSIIGVDHIPYSYYRAKFAAEQVLRASGLPVTIVRVAQFHEFVDDMLTTARRGPVLTVPRGWRVQPVAVAEAAAHLCDVLAGSPDGRVREFAGPEQLDLPTLAHGWADIQQPSPRVLALPIPGKLSSAFRSGNALSDAAVRGTVTYPEHLTGARQ